MSNWRKTTMLLAALTVAATVPPSGFCAESETVQIGWLSQAVKRTLPRSYLDQPPQDEGLQGAPLGIADHDRSGAGDDDIEKITTSTATT